MDETTEKLLELINSSDSDNWKLASALVINFDLKYKYYLLFFMVRQLPGICLKCGVTYGKEVGDMMDFIMNYIKANKLLPKFFNGWHELFDLNLEWVDIYISQDWFKVVQKAPCCQYKDW